MKHQLAIFLVTLVCFSALGVGAGWYAGTSLVRDVGVTFGKVVQEQNEHITNLESTVLLIAQDASALRDSLVAQQLLAQEETNALRTALDEKVGELTTVVGSQEDKLADLADSADISGLIDTWSPFVYDITCFFENEDDEGKKIKNSGSASLMQDTDGVKFVTNAHVTKDTVGGDLVSCELERDGVETIVVDAPNIEISEDEDIDVAYGRVPRNPPAMGQADICMTAPRIGERVVILGYPQIGAKESVTVTEGIISGFDEVFYTTSAKIESGNSGGAAVSAERDCFLGIPTLVFAGRIESLARILPALSLQ